MELNTLGIFIITTILILWLYLRTKYNYWKKRGLETPPYYYILGNFKCLYLGENSFADRSMNFYSHFKSRGLKHGGLYMLWMPTYVPIDVVIIKHIIQIDFQYFQDRGFYSNEKGDPLSAHLFSLSGTKWKLLRKKLTPTFTSGKMKMMHETIVACTKGIHDVMEKEIGKPLDIKEISGRFTTDVVGSCAFGLECNSLQNSSSEFRKNGKDFFKRNFIGILRNILLFTFPKLGETLNVRLIDKNISRFFLGVVETTVSYREKNNVARKDFMHLLIELKNTGKLVDDKKFGEEKISSDDNTITMNEIAAQAFVFFVAGFETSSTAMTFCLYELARNKSVQDKVRGHIKEILEKHNNQLTYEAATEMHYLEQVINEALRKYPPLSSLDRVCTKDYRIPGTDVVIEKGTKVLIPIMGLHRDPEIYPEPDKFDPERFSEENVKKRNAFSFLPFGDGPRVCIGTRFGMMQTKVGLVALILDYEFTVSSKTKEPIQFDRTTFPTSPDGGIWLDYKKISSENVGQITNEE